MMEGWTLPDRSWIEYRKLIESLDPKRLMISKNDIV